MSLQEPQCEALNCHPLLPLPPVIEFPGIGAFFYLIFKTQAMAEIHFQFIFQSYDRDDCVDYTGWWKVGEAGSGKEAPELQGLVCGE